MSQRDDTGRGAAEEMADVPLTETEEQTSRRPAGQPDDGATGQQDDEGISVDAGADSFEEDEDEF